MHSSHVEHNTVTWLQVQIQYSLYCGLWLLQGRREDKGGLQILVGERQTQCWYIICLEIPFVTIRFTDLPVVSCRIFTVTPQDLFGCTVLPCSSLSAGSIYNNWCFYAC